MTGQTGRCCQTGYMVQTGQTAQKYRSDRSVRPVPILVVNRNLPRHLLHLPQPLDRLHPGRNRPHHHRTPLEVLEACSTVDPPLRSSSARTDHGNGFVVSSLCFPVFFPFRGVSPAPVNGRRRRRRTWCRLRRGSKVMHRGRSDYVSSRDDVVFGG